MNIHKETPESTKTEIEDVEKFMDCEQPIVEYASGNEVVTVP